jgi:hypothetical protein
VVNRVFDIFRRKRAKVRVLAIEKTLLDAIFAFS